MALTGLFSFQGMQASNAYFRITTIVIKKTEDNLYRAEVYGSISSDKSFRNEPISSRIWEVPYKLFSVDNAFVQAYDFVKTVDEFKTWQNC